MNPSLLFHTVRYLKPVQIYGRLWRPRRAARRRGTPRARMQGGAYAEPIRREAARTGPNRFRFLNEERTLRGWNDEGVPKLWLYNLHYFEAPDAETMRQWTAENPEGEGNGWEPYPLSLRMANWVKWALAGGELPEECAASLARQAEWLENAVEFHLMANHLMANAKALISAGAYFEGSAAERWLEKGSGILEAQLREQVLADGGHFERSPMYHSLIAEDLLDLANLARAYPQAIPRSWAARWEQSAAAMLGWLRRMCHPDGEIAFFNDAATGVAPEPRKIYEYAGRLGIGAREAALGESGYIRLEYGEATAIFDAAPVGPDYQPGHAHADALSFELSVRGRRTVVNCGTSTYEPGEERQRQRGTAAHSTVMVDGENQSEVWSAFRVARRARVTDCRTDGATYAEAAHDGYRRLAEPVIHRRRLEFRPGVLAVTDRLEGSGRHTVEVYFHAHPEAKPEIRLDARLEREERAGTYHPAFNVSIPNRAVVGRYSGPLPATFESTIAI